MRHGLYLIILVAAGVAARIISRRNPVGARRPSCSPATRPAAWRRTSPSCRGWCGETAEAAAVGCDVADRWRGRNAYTEKPPEGLQGLIPLEKAAATVLGLVTFPTTSSFGVSKTVPDIAGYAVANALDGKSDDEVRAMMGDKFPKRKRVTTGVLLLSSN